MKRDKDTQSLDSERRKLLRELERIRTTVSPEQYAYASARIVHQLSRLRTRQRYAIT